MHTHGGWGIEGRGERKEGRGGGGMSKLDAKKGSRKIEQHHWIHLLLCWVPDCSQAFFRAVLSMTDFLS
jgi:hypothetical protein